MKIFEKHVQYPIEKIHYSNEFIVREDILEQSRQMYQETGELIPICLKVGELINGYEQILVAKENNMDSIPYIEAKPSKEELKVRRKRNKNRRKKERRQNIKLNGEYYSGRWFDYRPQKKRRRNLFG